MRIIDEGIEAATEGDLVGTVTISCPGPIVTPVLSKALRDLVESHPRIMPRLISIDDESVGEAIRSGAVDLAIVDNPSDRQELEVEALMPLDLGIYAAPNHAIFSEKKPVNVYDFVAPPQTPNGQEQDGWGPEGDRVVRFRVSQMFTGMDLCAQGQLLAVLPRVVAESRGLSRVTNEGLLEKHLYIVCRRHLPVENKTGKVIEALKTHVRETLSQSSQT